MIVEYVRYELIEHEPRELIAAYRDASAHLGAAPECSGFELSQCEVDAKHFVLRIHWTSSQAHTEGFRKGKHFAPFLAAIAPFIPEIREMRHYIPTDVRSTAD